MSFTLGKAERLKSQKVIADVFARGKFVSGRGFGAAYVEHSVRQAGFVVPKKTLKRAVDRNRVKRLMREAYRLNKHRLDKSVAVMFIYSFPVVKDQLPTLEQATAGIVRCIEKLMSADK